MLRSQTFDNFLAGCEHIEQILSLCGYTLSRVYGSNSYIATGLDRDGAQIFSPNIEVWTGSQQIAERQNEPQTVISFAAKISLGHQTSQTPWLSVLPVGDATDTPNGVFA